MSFLFKNLSLLDPNWKEARAGYEVLVEGDTIKEVSAKPIKAAKATVVNCGKRTLMPGLIDCHVHTHHSEVYINRMEAVPLTLMMARSARRLKRTEEEITAAVEEAHAFGRYVLTHAYTPEAITRAVKCGVRTIEHGNLVDAPTAKLMAQKGVYMIPNLVTYDAMKRRAAELGMPRERLGQQDEALKSGFAALQP